MDISPSRATPGASPTSLSGSSDAPRGESMVLWAIWLTYGSFYFCRQNIAAAVPGLERDGLRPEEVGLILGGLKIAYALGQLVNGQLAEGLPARWLLACGMLCSALLNVVFGLAEGLYFLIFIWALNGYCQALGWTPCVRVAANWIPPGRRGRALGIIGTSYQVMASVTYIVAGWSAHGLGWRGALYVPAVLLVAAAIHMLVFLREAPDEPAPEHASSAARARATRQARFVDNLWATLSNPFLWVLAATLFLLDACRYFFQDWGIKHLQDVQGAHVGVNAVKYAILPAGGIVGALFGGWATDRFFAGRRAPVICGLLVLLAVLTLSYDAVSQSSEWGTVALLGAIGFAIFGPQVLLVGTAPCDLARGGTAAAAAGFVNFMGYLGAFAGDLVTGYVRKHYDWGTAIGVWGACALAAAAVVATLWTVGPRGEIRSQATGVSSHTDESTTAAPVAAVPGP